MNQSIQPAIEAVMPEAIRSGLFTSLCTIQTASGDFTATGAPDGLYGDLAGHVDIPCMSPPLTFGNRVMPTEVKTQAEISSSVPHHVLLAGYYPSILSTYRAIIDGQKYEVMGVEHDSQHQMTRLAVREISL